MQPTPVQGQTLNSLSAHAQLSRGKGVTRGSFCPLSRTWGQAQGPQFFVVPLKDQQQDQPRLLRLHLGALSSSPSACEQMGGLKGSSHRIIDLRQCIQESERANESQESFALSQAQLKEC